MSASEADQPTPAPLIPLLKESSVDWRDPNKGDAVRTMFGGIARRYDLLNHLLSFNLDRTWRTAAVRLSQARPGDRVLDVCCGTGDLSFAFKKAVGDQGEVQGTDFTPEMIDLARQKASKVKAGIEFQVADTLRLPFPDASFDICSVGFGIRNVQDIAAGLREMRRVVRPGGRVVVLEFTQPSGKLFQQMYAVYMTRVLPLIGQVLSGSQEKAYSYLPDSVAQFPGPEDFAENMAQSGLRDVEWHKLSFGIVAVHVGRA